MTSHTAETSRNVEILLLGTLLHAPKEIYKITDILYPEHFFNTDTQRGYEVARDLAVEGKLDMITFSKSFNGNMWSPSEIADMSAAYTDSGAVPIEVMAYEIRDYAIIRKAEAVSKRIGVSNTVDEIKELYTELGESLDITHKKPFRLTWENPGKFVEDLCSSKRREKVTPTGFSPLDDLIVGLSGGELMVFGAVSGTGKTTWAMDVAWNIAKTKPVAFISVEMAEDELSSKFYSTISGVEPEKIKRGDLTPFDYSAFDSAVSEMEKRKLILDFHSHELDETVLRIRRLVSEHKVSVVLVDYCQQIEVKGKKNESREREVSRIVEALKRVAIQTGCAVILLSQISREGEKCGEPEIWHLRESGVLGQASDYVLLAWREIGKECLTHFKLSKNRPMSRLGRFSIMFHVKRMTYREAYTASQSDFTENKVSTHYKDEKMPENRSSDVSGDTGSREPGSDEDEDADGYDWGVGEDKTPF